MRFFPLALTAGCALLGACATPEPGTVSIVALLQRPAEHALVEGLRNYESGAFEQAERDLHAALAGGLQDRGDAAIAHKQLAFIACAFNRIAECEEDFRAAFRDNPGFALTSAEVGHPVWGPVYRRVAAWRLSTQSAK
jgi:hypothetical protein